MSVHGIYRPCPPLAPEKTLPFAPAADVDTASPAATELLHHKYRLPARCFAYVGSPADVHRWKLPYLHADSSPDAKRLPMAIQSILSNYRGAKVDIPRSAVPDVLVRLSMAAKQLRKLPCQGEATSPAYIEAHEALEQLDRLIDVGCCESRE